MRRLPQRQPKRLDGTALWEYALRVLTSRSYSITEMRRKLRRRAGSPADVEEVVGKLQQYGYLDDTSFAENFAAARLENQGFGKERVLRDLRARYVPAEIASRAADKVFAATDETRLIENYLERKYRTVSLARYLAEANHLASAYRRLRYAGFGAANTIRVLKRYSQRAQELETLEGDSE